MKKLANICGIICLLLCVLTGCKNSVDAVESQVPPSQEPAKITEKELHQKFELVYDDCGSSASDGVDQLTAELAALGKKAEADEKQWPENYETLYKTWRTSTIKERADTLQKEYEEIIAGRSLYEQGVNGLWETRPGVHYANYLDLNNDGKQELLLLSDCHIVEIYGDEKGHAVKYCEQSLGVPELSYQKTMEEEFRALLGGVSLAQKDGQFLIGAIMHGNYSASSHHPEGHIFYELKNKELVVADMVRLTDMGDFDMGTLEYPYVEVDSTKTTAEDLCNNDKGGDILREMTQAEYENKYSEKVLVAYAGPQEVGILQEDKIFPVPGIEVNGERLELEVAPYAYSGELMAPLRDVLEAMGVTIGVTVYDSTGESSQIEIFASTKTNSLRIANWPSNWGNSSSMGGGDLYDLEDWGRFDNSIGYCYSLNGNEENSIVVQNVNGKTFVPIQPIVLLFDANAEWDKDEKILHIISNIPDEQRMNQEELDKIINFTVVDALGIPPSSQYMIFGGSSGDFSAHFKIAFGKSMWEFLVVDYDNATIGDMVVYCDGTYTYTPTDDFELGWNGT